MSIIGYFISGIERYNNAEKYTKKIKDEMKEICRQFEISYKNGELGKDELLIKRLVEDISKIRRGLR